MLKYEGTYPADLGPAKSAAVLKAHRLEPEFGAVFVSFNMNVHWLFTIAGVEEEAIRPTPENGWHQLRVYIRACLDGVEGFSENWGEEGKTDEHPTLVGRLSLRRVAAPQHQVHDDAGDGHVEPDGEGDPGDLPVPVEALLERADERRYRERWHGDGEDRVRQKDRQVDGAHPAGARVARGAGLEVIREIADEEERRDGQGREHAAPVRLAAARLDERESRDEKHRARPVEAGVERREPGEQGRWHQSGRNGRTGPA